MRAGPRVLVVDDQVLNIELARAVLEAEGFVVEAALDAVQAARRVVDSAPDLILMDVQMPGVDGLKLTRQFKADPATRHIVIVAFTACTMKGDEARMLADGCDGCDGCDGYDGYIGKPIEVATFGATVRGHLEKGARPA